MTEYIEREAAVDKLTAMINESGKYTAYESGLDDAAYMIEHEIPAADVVPVVRCGECKWADNYGLDLMCQKHSGITKNKFGEDIHFVEWHSKYFFCADGERRDAK